MSFMKMYKHYIPRSSDWNCPITNSVPLFFFCGQKGLMQIRFTLWCIQWSVTSVLRSQQYKLGRNLHQIPRYNQSFVSGLDSSQHRSLHRTFRN